MAGSRSPRRGNNFPKLWRVAGGEVRPGKGVWRIMQSLPAGGGLVQNHAEGIEVGARVEFLATRLLRRHVCRRSRGGAARSQVLRAVIAADSAGCSPAPASRGWFGQAEIEHLGFTAAGDGDILRLDIAVADYPLRGRPARV